MLFRKSPISRHELVADGIYFSLSAFVSLLAVFVFDAHHFFYPPGFVQSPKFIFDSPNPYIFAVLFGGFLGFFLMKILFWAFVEEEASLKERTPPLQPGAIGKGGNGRGGNGKRKK